MKKPSEQDANKQSENINGRNRNSGSELWGQPDSKFGQKFGQKQYKPAEKHNARKSNKQISSLNDADDVPMVAAKGDDDLMSQKQQPERQQPRQQQSSKQPQQQPQGMASGDQMKGKWKQQVGAAKVAWGKLTEDELLRSEGHAQKLSGLVQERYAITRDEADKQVKKFMSSHN